MQLFINTDYTFTEQRYMRMVLFSGPSFMMRGIMTRIVSIEHTSYKAYAFSVAYILFWTRIIAIYLYDSDSTINRVCHHARLRLRHVRLHVSAPLSMYRMARLHCILQVTKVITRLWSYSSEEKLM